MEEERFRLTNFSYEAYIVQNEHYIFLPMCMLFISCCSLVYIQSYTILASYMNICLLRDRANARVFGVSVITGYVLLKRSAIIYIHNIQIRHGKWSYINNTGADKATCIVLTIRMHTDMVAEVPITTYVTWISLSQ